MEDSTKLRLGTGRRICDGAVGFQDTTNYHTVTPKATTPQFLLLANVVLTSFSLATDATHEARFSPYCRLCRLAKSLIISHSELMGWLVGAVGIELRPPIEDT
jgi:hypothetical protein